MTGTDMLEGDGEWCWLRWIYKILHLDAMYATFCPITVLNKIQKNK